MLPPAFLDRVRQQLGPEYEAFLASYHRPRALGLRLNPLKTDRPPILPFTLSPLPWAAYGFWYPSEERPGLHPWHEAGLYYLQEPSAMAPAELLGVEPGLRVLDLCAAPGGKSTQLAAKMRGQGLLVCNEYHPKRAKILSQNVERMAISNALVLQETPERLAKRFPGWFHRVLVDAPCSGEGMFRKEAAALEDWSPELVEMCARRQAGILDAAAELLAPGGRLVYSTCTFAPQEDEGAVAAFLARHPEFEIEVLDVPWFSPGDGAAGPGLEHTFRLWPHKLRGEGHYAAGFRPAGPAPGPLGGLRPGPGGSASGREGPGLRSKLVLGSGRAAGSHRTPGSAARPGAGPVPGGAVPAGPRPGPLALQSQPDLEPGPPGPGGRPVPGRGGASGQSLRLDSGDRRRPLPGVGKGLRRSPEEPLPQGPAAAHLLASHRLVILAGI